MSNADDTQSTGAADSVSPSTLERLRQHDDDEWQRMSATFAPTVLRWILRSGLSLEDAKDVLQEVFRGVAANIGGFRRDRDGDSFRGWLFSITKNKLADFRRQRRKTPLAIGGSDALYALQQLPAEEPLDQSVADEGMAATVQRGLTLIRNEFNERDFQACVRLVIGGERPLDVADAMGRSVNSVYLAKSRILRRLRQLLYDLHE